MVELSTGIIHRCAKPVGLAQDYARCLTASLPSTSADEPVHRVARARRLVVLGGLCLAIATPATAAQEVKQTTSIDALKLYAHSRIIDYKQFQCFNKLITAESHWNINAINGSHYGLGQMRNPKYRNLDGYRQIDWSIRYIKGRYGSMCNAYRHWHKHGWH